MVTQFARRLAGSIVTVVAVSVVVFLLMSVMPGDAAELVAGENATQEQVDAARARLGLDRSIPERYGSWLGGVAQGDFGTSLYTNRPVLDSLKQAAPATLSITLGAMAISATVGVAAGAIAGLRNGSWVDRSVSLMSTLGIAMPSFWVGLMLVAVFAFHFTLFPATGYAPISEGFGTWLRHLALPAIALGSATTAEVARQTRGGVVDVLTKPYVRAARARGASKFWLVRQHVLRNAAIPVVTVFGLQAASLLGGVVIVEAVFGISGLGTLAVTAVTRRDYPVVQAYVLVIAVVVVVVNLIVDLSYGWINPKVRS